MFNRKSKVVEPTFEDRFNAASAQAGAALSVFHAAAADLEDAASQKDRLVQEIDEEIDRLSVLQAEAIEAADADSDAAATIRNLIGA